MSVENERKVFSFSVTYDYGSKALEATDVPSTQLHLSYLLTLPLKDLDHPPRPLLLFRLTICPPPMPSNDKFKEGGCQKDEDMIYM